jgi:hypothetical protein
MRAVNNMVPVTSAGGVDVPDVAALAAATTWDTPVAQWVVPDPQQRPGVLQAWYAILVEHALSYGRVDLLSDRSAAAIWLDRTRPMPAPDHFLRRLTATCGKHAITVLRYEEALGKQRPRAVHLQLAVLASPSPDRAAALLAHRHQHLDQSGLAAHTIAGSLDQLFVMTAAGYQPDRPFQLPDGGPPMWPLWRPPQPVRVDARRIRRTA